jgi:hypothetical protein
MYAVNWRYGFHAERCIFNFSIFLKITQNPIFALAEVKRYKSMESNMYSFSVLNDAARMGIRLQHYYDISKNTVKQKKIDRILIFVGLELCKLWNSSSFFFLMFMNDAAKCSQNAPQSPKRRLSVFHIVWQMNIIYII